MLALIKDENSTVSRVLEEHFVNYNKVKRELERDLDERSESTNPRSEFSNDEDDPGTSIFGFALRQSDSDLNETIRVDNLVVSDDCADVFSAGCGTVGVEDESWGSVKSLFR